MFPLAAFVPSKEFGSNPLSGTVTLYPVRDCDSFFGLGVRIMTIGEAECVDDTLLGLGSFQSYKFTRIGDGKDLTSSRSGPFPFELLLQAFRTNTCASEGGKKTDESVLNGDRSVSGCVNTNAGVSAKEFSFRRIIVNILPLFANSA